MQLSEEKCVNENGTQDSDGICTWSILEIFAMIFGYVVVGFTQPLSFIAYVLRAFRLRRIFDAQLTYFKEDRKPVELIEKFRENRLIMITALSVGVVTIIYLTTALLLVYVPEGEKSMLYLLPTIDTASFVNRIKYVSKEEAQANFDQGMNINLYYLIVFTFAEGVVFLAAMQRIKDFKEDFNLLDELRAYALSWLFFTNLIIFLVV